MASQKTRKLVNQGRMTVAKAQSESLIGLKVAAARMATLVKGRVTDDDLYNWRSRGVPVGKKRVYLGWVRMAGRVYTTEEAVDRFFRATNGE